MHIRLGIAMLLLLLFIHASAEAQCLGRHAASGQLVQTHETTGQTMGNAYAISNWLPNGWPIIVYGPRFFTLPPLPREFVKFHECAHVSTPTIDEIQANCIALREMRHRGLSDSEEMQLALWTASEGSIGLQYGGTGQAFWQLTIRCAGPR